MDEWLAIRITAATKWLAANPDPGACSKDLAPRAKEERKSSWAYVERTVIYPDVPIRIAAQMARPGVEIFSRLANRVLCKYRPDAYLELQALALLLFDVKDDDRVARARVVLLCINRTVLDRALVSDVPAIHISEPYDPTHRELATREALARRKVAEDIIAIGYRRGFDVRDYTLDELKPVLRLLVSAKLVRPKYADVAARVLEE